jgi:uncharacterized protein YndB with AHSA1/START domain
MCNDELHIALPTKEIEMTAATIEREIRIDAPIEVVWDVVTNPKHIVNWFADEATLDLRSGGAGTLIFTEHNFVSPLRVETVDPPTVFSYRWSQPDGEEPTEENSMLVEFILSEEQGVTTLRFIESGFAKNNWSEEKNREYFDDHSNGWDFYLPRLTTYAATAHVPTK